MRTKFLRAAALFTVAASTIILNGCAETAGTGEPVAIPQVRLDCRTNTCKVNTSGFTNPIISAVFTTSGCIAPDFGYVATASTTSYSCTVTNGCQINSLAGWVDANGDPITTIPSGSYSICARIDFNRDFPSTTSGDAYGTLDNVSVTGATFVQEVDSWVTQ